MFLFFHLHCKQLYFFRPIQLVCYFWLYSLKLQNGVYDNLVECNCTLMYWTTCVVECCIVATIEQKTFWSSILIFIQQQYDLYQNDMKMAKNVLWKGMSRNNRVIEKCHFDNFSILPKWPKAFFWSKIKMTIRKNFHNMSLGLPNPVFMQKKVQKGDFLKRTGTPN